MTANVRNDRTEHMLLRLEAFAQEHGHTITELALAWLLSHPEIPVIINGAESPEHITANVKAAEVGADAGGTGGSGRHDILVGRLQRGRRHHGRRPPSWYGTAVIYVSLTTLELALGG